MGFKRAQDDDGRYRLHHTGCQTLGYPARQHQAEVRGKPAHDTARHQHQHAAHVGAAVTITSQQPWRGEHGDGHGHHEARCHPLRPLLAQLEVTTHVRHRHVDDGGRHDGRHRADHHRQKQQPAVPLAVMRLQLGQGGGMCQVRRFRSAARSRACRLWPSFRV